MDSGPRPRRGEIWRVDFEPTRGAEIRKARPAVVVSSDSVGRLPIKLVAPITEWKHEFAADSWHVRVEPDETNGLTKTSAIDVLQCRGADLQRFAEQLGHVAPEVMERLAAAIALLVEYSPQAE